MTQPVRRNAPEVRVIHSRVLRWFRRFGRPLPWRKTRNAYRILVSEIMLQQTQVSRVLLAYPSFLRKFPTIEALGRARRSEVVVAWKGMGYNNRAVRLHKLANVVVEQHKGQIPQDLSTLVNLPGIGPNSARGIACFAHGQQVPVLDTNVHRVLARLFPGKRSNAEMWITATRMLPPMRAYEWNQALMDLGATICKARAPRCGDCPLHRGCPSAGRVLGTRSFPSLPEPRMDGVPRRIVRGRIIDALRQSRRPLTARSIAKYVGLGMNGRVPHKLKTILTALEKDGLLRIVSRDRQVKISLSD